MAVAQTGWSTDGNWFWDGARWNDAISQDGQWRFDGANWQPFAGQRSAMPAPPLPPAPQAPPAPPQPTPSMPSWVAASEVQRLESEKIERQLAQMIPEQPIPPELDWRQVGERMEYSDYSHNPTFASWQVGGTSIVIYLVLLWLCGPLSAIFPWFTGWRTSSKVLTTLLSLAGLILLAIAVIALNVLPQSTSG